MTNGLLYAITVLVWGTTWMAIEFQLGVVAPDVSVFYRFLLATCLLLGWCALRGQRLRFERAAHLRFAMLGLMLFSLNYLLTYHAQLYISSALTAIVFSTMLWMNIVNSRLFFGVRAPGAVWGGSLLGIAGILVLFLPEAGDLTVDSVSLYGMGLALFGALVASLGNMVSQAAQQRGLPIVQSNAWGMFYGALFSGASCLAQGRDFNIDWSAPYLLSLLYLTVLGSIVAFGTYLTLLGRIGASRAGYAVVMFPVVAILLSTLMGEIVLNAKLLTGIVLVLGGNAFVLRSRRRVPDAATPLEPGASGALPGLAVQKSE